MLDAKDRFALAGKAQEALNRMHAERTSQIKESSKRTVKTDFAKMIFEEYDDETFEKKIRIDSIFYKTLLKNLEESHTESVRQILTNLLVTTKQIYEHVNIKPKVYGFNMVTVFNDSDKILEESASRMINDYIKNQYHSLTAEQREAKYLPAVRSVANSMVIQEQINPEDAIKFATKVTVMEGLIERISFPLAVRSKVEELLTDEDYGKMFEQERLNNLWESFHKQATNVAKIIAATI